MNLLDTLRDDAKQLLDQEVPGLEEARSVLGALVRRVEAIELYLAHEAGVVTHPAQATQTPIDAGTAAAPTEGTPPAPAASEPAPEPTPAPAAEPAAAEAPSRDVQAWQPGA